MGKWSRHPLGSDRVLDIQDYFLGILAKEPGSYYFDLEDKEITQALLSLTEAEIKERIESDDDLNKNRFVIPYSYLEYSALTKDKNIRALLKECLDYHSVFKNRDTQELNHINRFKIHFDEIFNGEYDLENDKGLCTI